MQVPQKYPHCSARFRRFLGALQRCLHQINIRGDRYAAARKASVQRLACIFDDYHAVIGKCTSCRGPLSAHSERRRQLDNYKRGVSVWTWASPPRAIVAAVLPHSLCGERTWFPSRSVTLHNPHCSVNHTEHSLRSLYLVQTAVNPSLHLLHYPACGRVRPLHHC